MQVLGNLAQFIGIKAQGRSLNQAAVDAIATRIDTYEQSWQRRWEKSDKRWDARIDRLFEGIDAMKDTAQTIAQKVEEIADFIGTATEEQRATQIRLETLEEKVDRRFDQLTQTLDRMTASIQEQQKSIDEHLRVAEQQQATTQELIRLVTVIAGKAA